MAEIALFWCETFVKDDTSPCYNGFCCIYNLRYTCNLEFRDLRVNNVYLVEEPLLQEDILILGDFAVASVMCDTRTCTRRTSSRFHFTYSQNRYPLSFQYFLFWYFVHYVWMKDQGNCFFQRVTFTIVNFVLFEYVVWCNFNTSQWFFYFPVETELSGDEHDWSILGVTHWISLLIIYVIIADMSLRVSTIDFSLCIN